MTVENEKRVTEFLGKIQKNRPNAKTRNLWTAILDLFDRQEPPMTVRQVFYQMATIGEVEKSESGYSKVQRALTNMRRSGVISYDWIIDNTRQVHKRGTFGSLSELKDAALYAYRREMWETQPIHLEIFLEKDALTGVLEPITREYDVALCVARGYSSISFLHEISDSLHDIAQDLSEIEKPIFIYHLGDHDASGKDAARAIEAGLRDFGVEFTFIELAVNEDQIAQFNLPTREAKPSDKRAKNWGNKPCVELDAIPPDELRELVRETIESHIDWDKWNQIKLIEQQERATLANFFQNFETKIA